MVMVTLLGFFINLLFNMFLSRNLGPANYGDFKVAEALIDLGSLVALMGGAKAALRFLPDYLSDDNQAAVWAYVRLYSKLILLVSAIFVIVLFLTGYLHIQVLGHDLHPVLLAAIVVPFAALSALMGSVLQTARRLDLAFVPWALGYPLLKLVVCVVLFYSGDSLNDVTAVASAFLAAVLIMGFEVVQVLRLGLMRIAPIGQVVNPSVWLNVSLPLMFISVLQVLLNQANIYMLEIMGDETQVGIFAAASTSVGFFFILKQSVSNVLVPLMPDAAKSGRSAIARLNSMGFKRLLLLSGVLTAMFVVCADPILRLYGADYGSAKITLFILLLGYVPTTVFSLSAIWLKYSGYERFVVKTLLTAVCVNVLLNLILIPMFGIEGAAAASSIALLSSSLLLSIKMHAALGVYPWSGLFSRFDGH